MKKTILVCLLALALVSAPMLVSLLGFWPQKVSGPPTVTTLPVAGGHSDAETDRLIAEWEEKKRIKAENEAVTKSKEISVGDETFQKLNDYIRKHGFTIYDGRLKQYTFFDSRGNRHAYITSKVDAAGDDEVDQIVVYGYYKGIRDLEHFFSYFITDEKVFNPIPDLDGGWEDYDSVAFGYNEFLKKVSK